MLHDDETNNAVKHYKKLQQNTKALYDAVEKKDISQTTAKWQAWKKSILDEMDYFKKNPWCARDERKSSIKALLTPEEIDAAIEDMDFALSNFSYEHAQLVLLEHQWLANEYAPSTSELMPGAPFVAIALTEADHTTAKLFLKCEADLALKGPHGKTIKGYIKSREDYDAVEKNTRLSWMDETLTSPSYVV